MNVELRAITKTLRTMDRPIMICSVNPSLKYSWFGSPLIFIKGSTVSEGSSGNGNAIFSTEAVSRKIESILLIYLMNDEYE